MASMNSFEKAVASVPDVAGGYCQGLAALGSDSRYVTVGETRSLDGSVNIDSCTKSLYPDANRWDYVISYAGKAYYVEVHPATGGMVKVMEAKLAWLKQWLRQKAKPLEEYPAGSPRFSWVHTGKCGLSKTSTEYRRAAMMGLIPRKSLRFGK